MSFCELERSVVLIDGLNRMGICVSFRSGLAVRLYDERSSFRQGTGRLWMSRVPFFIRRSACCLRLTVYSSKLIARYELRGRGGRGRLRR